MVNGLKKGSIKSEFEATEIFLVNSAKSLKKTLD